MRSPIYKYYIILPLMALSQRKRDTDGITHPPSERFNLMKIGSETDSHPAERAGRSIAALRKSAATCRACPLWENATQTVFGEGPANAPIMLIGEQPGDQEDRMGHPFVGPAGQLLARALATVDIPHEQVYITNAVKHFKFELRGKRCLHKKPVDAEIAACHAWLRWEIELVAPRLLMRSAQQWPAPYLAARPR